MERECCKVDDGILFEYRFMFALLCFICYSGGFICDSKNAVIECSILIIVMGITFECRVFKTIYEGC